ncbi:MAG: hypothetical protein WAZ40_00250 [Minisyncoccia bacterium]
MAMNKNIHISPVVGAMGYIIFSIVGIKYYAKSTSNTPRVDIMYNQENPGQNISNTFTDWFQIILNFLIPITILFVAYFGFKKKIREVLQSKI